MYTQIKLYIQDRAAIGRQKSTLENYKRTLTELAEFCPAWPVTQDTLRLFFLHKRETCNGITVCSIHSTLNVFFNWTVKQGFADCNPLANMDKPTKPGRLPKVIPKTDLKTVFTTLTAISSTQKIMTIRDCAMMRFAYDSGCRASEIAGVLICNLDLGYNSCKVIGKGNKERVIFYGHKCADALRAWLRVHPGGRYLFPSRIRIEIKPLTRKGVSYVVRRACCVAHVEGFTAHQLRHSYATHALRAGIDLEHISRQLGHSDIKTTMVYLGLDDEDRRRAHLRNAPGDTL